MEVAYRAGSQADMYSVTGTPWRVVVADRARAGDLADAPSSSCSTALSASWPASYLSQPASP